MPKPPSSFASLPLLVAVAGIALAANPGSERIVVRSEQDLPSAWAVTNPDKDIDLLTLKGTRLRYGCVNVAYLIESDGRIAENTRLLAYRADRTQAAREDRDTHCLLPRSDPPPIRPCPWTKMTRARKHRPRPILPDGPRSSLTYLTPVATPAGFP